MGALAAAGRKRRDFKEGGVVYGEMTARGSVNSPEYTFLNRLC